MTRNATDFDRENANALRRIWFLGDVHGEFKHLARASARAADPPAWLVFLGDVDIEHRPFREVLEPLRERFPDIQVAFIHGNHDADTYEHWAMLHDCGSATPIHGKIVDLGGIKVAGLGGVFMGRIWIPPAQPAFDNKEDAMNRGRFQWRDGMRPNPALHGAIYADDYLRLQYQRADILVTHEAPSCHPHGFEAIDELARSMQVIRTFHGHHHDDGSEEYALVRKQLRFDARGVNYCAIKNGLGEHILEGPKGW